jgi:peroxiredoxin
VRIQRVLGIAVVAAVLAVGASSRARADDPSPAERAVLAAENDPKRAPEAMALVQDAIKKEPKSIFLRILEARVLLLDAKAAKTAERPAAYKKVMDALQNATAIDLWDPAPFVFALDVHQAMGNTDHAALEETTRAIAIRLPGDQVARDRYLRQAGKVPAIKDGDPLPRVKWKDGAGNDVTSDSLWANGPVIIELYRSVVWCNYCRQQLYSLNDALPKFKDEQITIVAASPDTSATIATIEKDKALKGKPFSLRLLSDPKGETADKLGFLNPETVKKGVPDDQFGLPFPTTIIVDNRGVVRFVKTHLDYKVRVKPDEMLTVAKKIRVELTPEK